MFVASLKKAIRAEKLKPGDPVEFDTLEATLIGGKTVVPANAVLHGRVVEAQPANREAKQESRLAILVESVTWKKNSVPVCARITGFGSREYKYDDPDMPVPAFVPRGWDPDQLKSRSPGLIPQPSVARSGIELLDHEFGSAQEMPDAFTVPGPVTVRADEFVKGIFMRRSATAATVLARKDKNVDLPGGLLVAIQQLQGTENGCPAAIAP